jgi:hypothetical protein
MKFGHYLSKSYIVMICSPLPCLCKSNVHNKDIGTQTGKVSRDASHQLNSSVTCEFHEIHCGAVKRRYRNAAFIKCSSEQT